MVGTKIINYLIYDCWIRLIGFAPRFFYLGKEFFAKLVRIL